MIARLPFVGFVFFYAAGILLAGFVPWQSGITDFAVLATFLPLFAGAFFCYFKGKFTFVSALFSLFLTTAGLFSTALQNQKLTASLHSIDTADYDAYEAVVKTLPEKRAKSIRFELAIIRLRVGHYWAPADGRALISLPVDAAEIPKPLDHLLVIRKLERPKSPLNPGEFDYRNYLWNKGIGLIAYLPAGSYQIIRQTRENFSPGLWSMQVSEWADQHFRANLKDDRSYGLVKAMLLGRRDDLRSDQIDDYTTSGTVHILSVSGMHVAMIFLVISLLFGWMKRLPGGKYLYLVTVTALLVFYSVITGFPPSVQRATVMCVVLVIAEVFGKRHNSVNTLGVSAFIILLLDPHALFDVGFQLSYLAMLGIFLFYKPLEKIWIPNNWLLVKIWQVTALSFAAQLTTFPLSIYYFHQFPSYFWLVNPFVVAFTNALLPAAMLLLLTALFPIGFLQTGINWLVDLLAYLTNVSAAAPKLLPGFLVENLYLDRIEVLALYILLLAVCYAYESREFPWLRAVPLSVLVFVLYSTYSVTETFLRPKVVFHVVPKHDVISFKEGNKLFISCDDQFPADSSAYVFHLKNYAIEEGITERIFFNNKNPDNPASFYSRQIHNGTLFNWHGRTIWQGPPKSINIDYQLITEQDDFGEMPANGQRTIFLAGGTMRRKSREKLKEQIRTEGNRFYDLESSGALLLR